MEYIPNILAAIALLIAIFTFYRLSSVLSRVRGLEKRNRKVEDELKALKDGSSKGSRTSSDSRREPRAGQTTQPPGREPRQSQDRQPQQEGRQKQPREQTARGGQQTSEGRAAQSQTQQEPRQKQEPREPKQPREPRQTQEPRAPKEPRQPQEGRQKQPRTPQLDADGQPIARTPQNQRRNEGQRRQPVTETPSEENAPAQPIVNPPLAEGLVGDDLLNELTQPQAPVSRIRYAMIPEDGLVKTHQLQQQPDSDSYLEIDAPQDGSTTTRYRFNVKGNQAFVISQGMDRLENAFEFEKPSNRMVNRIVLQGDGVLTRTTSGWKIQEKARIDFR